ncbi:hypothetical protein [Novispirillum itersonii]|uniref:Uncharacterized protein n=1 Tax=Novispirillum itersonii TaxID=189 RepID=A0A7W9ZIZ4_NOVIT|nr:hypothetical protein [Novispirillum itersonii]MBB6212336.1 hypothetical protein [Novispirillum itersonii]
MPLMESAMNNQEKPATTEPDDGVAERPVWHRPAYSILDVEAGTVTTSGPRSDGNGSTS